ncbi:MAG: tRNA (adenosine(37)-N6)-threonylcarbamoyltransferase complex dimerization subunit type 1 TsaB [Candidatus Xiphinematobacter sp.]|nr:MAG: tRNA (adenosine(37)-N6)-threonylcarbamoyltransferase complex dimerization subunit type 1 TsaB [Candidatus Xiphinematobacter sp.]
MRVLAIEASAHLGSVAIRRGDKLLVERFAQPRGGEGALCRALEKVIGREGRVHRIAVGIGPGTYNGIRAAISLATGLKIAWRVPLCGIPSVLGVESPAERYAVVGDARGGSLFFGTVSGQCLENLQLLSHTEFQKRLFVWRQTCRDPVYTVSPVPAFPKLCVLPPNAGKLAFLAKEYPTSEQGLSPLYLKPPHTTQSASQFTFSTGQ